MPLDMILLMDKSVYGDIQRAKSHINSLYRKAATDIVHLIMDSASKLQPGMPIDEFLAAQLIGNAILNYESDSSPIIHVEAPIPDINRINSCYNNIELAFSFGNGKKKTNTKLSQRFIEPLLFAANPYAYDSDGPDHNHLCNVISQVYRSSMIWGQDPDSARIDEYAAKHVENIRKGGVYTSEELDMFEQIGWRFSSIYDSFKKRQDEHLKNLRKQEEESLE